MNGVTVTGGVRTRVEVAAGGASGALVRWGLIALAVGVNGAGDLVAVLVANVVGTFALAWLVTRARRTPRAARAVAFVGSGLLGSLTTFSGLVLQLHGLVATGRVGTAVALAAVSLLGGVTAAVAGVRLGARVVGGGRR